MLPRDRDMGNRLVHANLSLKYATKKEVGIFCKCYGKIFKLMLVSILFSRLPPTPNVNIGKSVSD